MIWLVPAIAGGICLIGFVALWRMYVWETKPKRLTGAALEAYITELEYDTEIVERPATSFPPGYDQAIDMINRAKTRPDLDAAYRYLAERYDIDPRTRGVGSLDPYAHVPRDPLGRFDNNGKRIANIRVDYRDANEPSDISSPAELVRRGWNDEVAIRATRDRLRRDEALASAHAFLARQTYSTGPR